MIDQIPSKKEPFETAAQFREEVRDALGLKGSDYVDLPGAIRSLRQSRDSERRFRVRLEEIQANTTPLMVDIMNNRVNEIDEAEKWLREFAPHELRGSAVVPATAIDTRVVCEVPLSPPHLMRCTFEKIRLVDDGDGLRKEMPTPGEIHQALYRLGLGEFTHVTAPAQTQAARA